MTDLEKNRNRTTGLIKRDNIVGNGSYETPNVNFYE